MSRFSRDINFYQNDNSTTSTSTTQSQCMTHIIIWSTHAHKKDTTLGQGDAFVVLACALFKTSLPQWHAQERACCSFLMSFHHCSPVGIEEGGGAGQKSICKSFLPPRETGWRPGEGPHMKRPSGQCDQMGLAPDRHYK